MGKETKKETKKTAKKESKQKAFEVTKEILNDSVNMYILKTTEGQVITMVPGPESVVNALHNKLLGVQSELKERLIQVEKGLNAYEASKDAFVNIVAGCEDADPEWISKASEIADNIKRELDLVSSAFVEIGGNAPRVFIDNYARVDICGFKIVKAHYEEL